MSDYGSSYPWRGACIVAAVLIFLLSAGSLFLPSLVLVLLAVFVPRRDRREDNTRRR
jgi:hypothetical protein